MIHKVESITALPNFKLSIHFTEGVTKIYNVALLFDTLPMFADLKNRPEEFYTVKVDVGGHGIIWRDNLDLSCDELWKNGVAITEKTSEWSQPLVLK